MDDGSDSTGETLEILRIMKNQGVDTVVATPHFYAENEDPEEFLTRREKSLESLMEQSANSGTLDRKILNGAEVHYFNGCGRTREMDNLLIEGTKLLLLEMPFKHFSMNIIDDIMALRQRGIRPVIAHLNRYKTFDDDEFIDFCNEEGILIQLNTECIIERPMRRRSIGLLADERVQFIGTDCHGLLHRKPNKAEALNIIADMLSPRFVQDFIRIEEEYLNVTSQQ